ncbi:hypothetical protein IV203_027735 [Nitzschia inconspicua]|uniref:Uncharacterized protein n=1 Tax=Nitzschia inconspicua TaxID=303405 RepID=A0A9K3Q6C1_9STRA|nr:hypothetical protein IV203_027735 [Nitzschia inconspicua]
MTSESTITAPKPSATRFLFDLQKLHHDSLNWRCNLFFDGEIDEQTGKPSMQHDLSEVLAEGWPFKFRAKYRGLASRTQLAIDLKLVAIQCEFCLFTRSSAGISTEETKSMRQVYVIC